LSRFTSAQFSTKATINVGLVYFTNKLTCLYIHINQPITKNTPQNTHVCCDSVNNSQSSIKQTFTSSNQPADRKG